MLKNLVKISKKKSAGLIGVVTYLFLSNEFLMACATCSSAYTQEKINAYISVTFLLIAIPITFTISIVLFLRRGFKKAKANEEQ